MDRDLANFEKSLFSKNASRGPILAPGAVIRDFKVFHFELDRFLASPDHSDATNR